MSRPLGDLRLAVLMLDGIDLKGRCCVVALGIDTDGVKHPLGLWDGSTENATVATTLLANRVERGLDGPPLLRRHPVDRPRAGVTRSPTGAPVRRAHHPQWRKRDARPREGGASPIRAGGRIPRVSGGEFDRQVVLFGVAGKADGGGKADEGERGEGAHRDHVGPVSRGEIRDQDRAGNRRAKGRAEIGDAAREP